MSSLEELLKAKTLDGAEPLLKNTLDELGDDAVPALINAYEDAETIEGVWGVLECLRRLGDRRALPIFGEVKKRYPGSYLLQGLVRDAEIEFLSKSEKIKRRLKDLESRNWLDVFHTVACLGDEGDESVIPDLLELKTRWKKKELLDLIDVAIFTIREGIEGLIGEYFNENSSYSKGAIRDVLGQKSYKEAIPVYVEALYSNDHMQHDWATCYIDVWCYQSVIPRLKEILLTDPRGTCRVSALSALVKVSKPNDKENIEFLQDYLDRKKWRTKWKPWRWVREAFIKKQAKAAIESIKGKRE